MMRNDRKGSMSPNVISYTTTYFCPIPSYSIPSSHLCFLCPWLMAAQAKTQKKSKFNIKAFPANCKPDSFQVESHLLFTVSRELLDEILFLYLSTKAKWDLPEIYQEL